ncbi:glycine betaine ABC transporter substrate-binding protein [Lentibacillus cibarius]|uniref:Glycine betaine ABC transporter substrate-binding protein n=1 Tax=Lentibacillus cibarius TaxID=2583219 RepID=A0A549YIY7_9BACI|nr:glycine betaine ABC transporter substrate-binding protein [Lentibacillus cibarius]TMN23030.1 glycine betaine ABC transporter substrate-binding protein [Lentibacillus cibarius]TRM11841.1 glycine betaine ABC transporter substrate-binding protein [Lentibacillus cibarius]
MFKNLKLLGLAAALLLAVTLVACGGGDNEGESDNSGDSGNGDEGDSASGVELGEKELEVPYVAWAGAIARTPLVEQVLEDVGYTVETKQVDAGAMWSSVANGGSAFMTASWLPATHKSYQEKFGDDVEDIGNFVDQAPLALTVPSYMDIDSVEDLKDNEELGEAVDWTITGIDPGAGIMQNTTTALEEYGLDNWELQRSSEGAMLSQLQKKIEDEEPIIVPGWKPHWMFAELDLKMLDDPKEVYGGDGDRVGAIANKNFKEDSPAAYKVLKRLTEDYNEEIENELLVKINDGAEPEDAAKQFIEDNQDLIEKWTTDLE